MTISDAPTPRAPAPGSSASKGAEQVATRSRGGRRWRLGVVLAHHAHDKPHHWTLAARTGHVQAPEQIALKEQRPGRCDTRRRGFTRDPVVTGRESVPRSREDAEARLTSSSASSRVPLMADQSKSSTSVATVANVPLLFWCCTLTCTWVTVGLANDSLTHH